MNKNGATTFSLLRTNKEVEPVDSDFRQTLRREQKLCGTFCKTFPCTVPQRFVRISTTFDTKEDELEAMELEKRKRNNLNRTAQTTNEFMKISARCAATFPFLFAIYVPSSWPLSLFTSQISNFMANKSEASHLSFKFSHRGGDFLNQGKKKYAEVQKKEEEHVSLFT